MNLTKGTFVTLHLWVKLTLPGAKPRRWAPPLVTRITASITKILFYSCSTGYGFITSIIYTRTAIIHSVESSKRPTLTRIFKQGF